VRVRGSAGVSSFRREERLQELLGQAREQLPALRQKQAEAERRASHGKHGKHGEKIRQRQPRGSTTDPEARRMKMPNGGFNPAGSARAS
jgi:hypothetical protein